MGWCFVPSGHLVAGDVMLAQKIALEQIPQEASRRGFSWRRIADSIFATESGGWDGKALQHGFA
jgi:hypothetical protein